MDSQLLITISLLTLAMALFVWNRFRMDAVALLMLVLLTLSGVVTTEEALTGFSDPNIILIAALFVIGDSLARTGVAQRVGDLIARGGKSEHRLLPLLMASVAAIGSVMSSTAVVAIFIPITLRIAQHTRIPPARLMMPLSVGALISGMMTLVATAPNLVVNAELLRHDFQGFQFFTFTPFGVPILAVGIAYMLIARKWLTPPHAENHHHSGRPHLSDWISQYALTQREHRLRVQRDSPLVGRHLRELDLRSSAGVNVVAIERPTRFSHRVMRPLPTTELHEGDILFLDVFAAGADIEALAAQCRLQALPISGSYFLDHSQEIGMAEGIIPAGSRLLDKTIIGNAFRTEYDLSVIGLRRGSTPQQDCVLQEKLRVGDTLLMIGPWRAIRRLQADHRDIVLLGLPAEIDDVLPAASKWPHALAVLTLVITLMVTGIIPNVWAAITGCLLLGLLGCIDFNSAYRAIHWQTLILIVGMMPFAIALQKSGGVDIAAQSLLQILGQHNPRLILAGLYVITVILGLFISNTTTAVLMAPIALEIARETALSPYPFAMTVALAASAAFLTPVSSPVNMLVMGPGNYRFADFVRIGLPLAAIVMLLNMLLIPTLLPF